MLDNWNQAIFTAAQPIRGLRLPNTLELSGRHTALVVGHLLRRLYTDLLEQEQPERLRGLVDQLNGRESARVLVSQR